MNQFFTILALFLCVQLAQAETATLAIAANFTDASQALIQEFEKTSGHTVKASYGSTGKLFAQISHAAPFDALLAADEESVINLDAAGLTVSRTRFTYARGKLVLWSAKPDLLTHPEQYLKASRYAHIAIANPQTAPYGAAAQQVLQHLGMWSALQGRLVQGDSIAQTFQFVATQNAEAGFVARSQVLAWKSGGSSWNIPEQYYSPIIQKAVLLTRGKNNPAAISFLDFLKSEPARKIIRDFGYGVD
jgi:molybdate transport system substrate-binding protein